MRHYATAESLKRRLLELAQKSNWQGFDELHEQFGTNELPLRAAVMSYKAGAMQVKSKRPEADFELGKELVEQAIRQIDDWFSRSEEPGLTLRDTWNGDEWWDI